MDITKFAENKSVIYTALWLYFIFLCVVSQKGSIFVGVGFGSVWLMSLFTRNVVECIVGSLGFTSCFIIIFAQSKKEPFSLGEGCNAICFEENKIISQKNDDLQIEITSLKKDITDLTNTKNRFSQLVNTIFRISSS